MRYLTLAFALWLVGAGFLNQQSSAETDSHNGKEKSAAADELFSGKTVVRIQIEIPRAGMLALRNSGWGNGQDRPVAKATVREGGTTYTEVGIHLKGSAGSFRSIDEKPALTLHFDDAVSKQSFHGLHKISLNNSVQDRSFLAEKISRELFESAGVPVPRAANATVELNGRNLGLYVLLEGVNKQFLKRHFSSSKGNLYDGGFVQDVTASLNLNSGEGPKDQSDRKALVAAAYESDATKRFARLNEVLDMDKFLSFVAMEVIECHWDGYTMNRNNWRLYHDIDANKMMFIPHGLDQMFGIERTSPECPILPSMQGLVSRAVVSTPEGKRQYLQRVAQLYTNVFKLDAILKRIDELDAVVRPVIAETSAQSARNHDQQVEFLKRRITQRDESLKRQIAAVANPIRLESNSGARLAEWHSQVQNGSPDFQEPQGVDRATALYIGANGNVIASWRAKAMLDPGVYRFEGRIRTKDIKSPEPNRGAGLRVSHGQSVAQLAGTNPWRDFVYSFQVQEGGGQIEFVCELRATQGQVWFDTTSLRVVRVR
jgi:spore coat protein H